MKTTKTIYQIATKGNVESDDWHVIYEGTRASRAATEYARVCKRFPFVIHRLTSITTTVTELGRT